MAPQELREDDDEKYIKNKKKFDKISTSTRRHRADCFSFPGKRTLHLLKGRPAKKKKKKDDTAITTPHKNKKNHGILLTSLAWTTTLNQTKHIRIKDILFCTYGIWKKIQKQERVSLQCKKVAFSDPGCF